MRHLKLLICALALAAGTAQAGPTLSPVDEALDCSDGGSTHYERTMCSRRPMVEADARLTRVYQALRKALRAEDKRAEQVLVSAQRAWIAGRDAETELCTAASWGLDGSGYGQAYASCYTSLLDERTAELRQYLRNVQSR